MVNEVESILHEIRERVRAEERQHQAVAVLNPTLPEDEVEESYDALNAERKLEEPEALARLSAHLTTTARAWDRLPPSASRLLSMLPFRLTIRLRIWNCRVRTKRAPEKPMPAWRRWQLRQAQGCQTWQRK